MEPATSAPPIEHGRAVINGLDYHYVTCGSGPAVLLVHGFPDSWRVWRHQIPAIAAAGYRVIAPDLRGWGETATPSEDAAYTAIDILSDLVQLLNHLGVEKTVIIGHDWGAAPSWAAPMLRPDRFTAVATISVPFGPRPPEAMHKMMAKSGLDDMYFVYFSTSIDAGVELQAHTETFFRRFFYTLSGAYDGDVIKALRRSKETGLLVDSLAEPPAPMSWCDEAEIQTFVDHVRARGVKPVLDVYRCNQRQWDQWGLWADLVPQCPAFFIYGNKEVSMRFPGREKATEEAFKALPKGLPPKKLEGDVGHWCMLEAPDQVNDALIGFLKEIAW